MISWSKLIQFQENLSFWKVWKNFDWTTKKLEDDRHCQISQSRRTKSLNENRKSSISFCAEIHERTTQSIHREKIQLEDFFVLIDVNAETWML